MSVLTKKSEEFLFKYLNNASPTGFEAPGQKIWLDGVINPGQDYKVVIEAHADEISWFVNHIDDKGFIKVVRNGGSDHQIATSKHVDIHTKKGIVNGVFGWPAIHTRRGNEKEKNPNLKTIFIDVGANSKEEVLEMGIHVGCVVTYPDELVLLNDRYYCGRALDNKMGGFCIAEVARLIKKNKVKLPYSLVAIVTDVTHDTHTPMLSPKEFGDIKSGEGPTITYAPAVHNILQEIIIEAATKKKIPLQREAASRYTGTDTDAFAYSNEGVPAALISLPLRYIYETLRKIKKNHNFKYL